MRLYTLMDGGVKEEFSERYRAFTYDMYALCKNNGCKIDFVDGNFDHYCDPQLDYNSPEELAHFTIREVDHFVAIVYDDSDYPRRRIDWALENYMDKEKLFVLIHESEKERSAPISKDSLKYKLYFEEKLYPHSYDYYDEIIFWIAVQIMNWSRLSPDVIRVKNDMLFFGDVFVGYVSRIHAINRFKEYRNAEERGVDRGRVAVDIIKTIAYVLKIQSYSYHEEFRHVMDAQLRGDNIGVSLMINHESLNEEIEAAFERYKERKSEDNRETIEIILTKMELGVLNSYLINCADENRDEYAEALKKDIKKHRNHLSKFKY